MKTLLPVLVLTFADWGQSFHLEITGFVESCRDTRGETPEGTTVPLCILSSVTRAPAVSPYLYLVLPGWSESGFGTNRHLKCLLRK